MPSRRSPEAEYAEGIALVEAFDNFAGLRRGLRLLSEERSHWAGIPMPLEDMSLVIHPRYPYATELMALGEKPTEQPPDVKFRNSFWSHRYSCTVVVYERAGTIAHYIVPGANHADQLVQTLGASIAWGIEQEHRALQLLGTLLRHHTYKTYLLTGTFLEQSPRSKITYVFRKLRPTLALKETKGGRLRILTALCGHPIAHYAGSWAGAMCPTDDVVAALMLMRGDEHMLWKRCSQHPPGRPEAGI